MKLFSQMVFRQESREMRDTVVVREEASRSFQRVARVFRTLASCYQDRQRRRLQPQLISRWSPVRPPTPRPANGTKRMINSRGLAKRSVPTACERNCHQAVAIHALLGSLRVLRSIDQRRGKSTARLTGGS